MEIDMEFVVTKVEHNIIQGKPRTNLGFSSENQGGYISVYVEPPAYNIKLGDVYSLVERPTYDPISE